MNKVVTYGDSSAITREASAWIAQLDGDEPPSSEDLAALQEWMSRSPAHRREIEHLAALWGDLNVLTDLAGSASMAASNPAPDRSARFGSRAGAWTWAGGLAAAVMVAVAAWLLAPTQAGAPSGGFEQALQTDVGKQLHQALPDGSEVTLNTNSRLTVSFSGDERRVHLTQGEAHFKVAKDANRPFVVLAADGAVRAVGTAFSVRLQQQDIEVTVAEGVVELSTVDTPETGSVTTSEPDAKPERLKKLAVLEAGQTASFNDRIESLQAIPLEELAKKLSWKEGMLVFSGDLLGEVVKEVGRYTRSDIVFADPALGELRIGGQFRVGEIDALFDALEVSFGVEVDREDDRIILSQAQTKSGS